MEENASVNFLTLTFSKMDNKHDFALFHKPTHTHITIYNSLLHSYQYKMGGHDCMIQRLINFLLSDKNFNLELNFIQQIAINNGHSSSLINLILSKYTF